MDEVASYTVNDCVIEFGYIDILLFDLEVSASAHIHFRDGEQIFNEARESSGLIDDDVNGIITVFFRFKDTVFKSFRITLNGHQRRS